MARQVFEPCRLFFFLDGIPGIYAEIIVEDRGTGGSGRNEVEMQDNVTRLKVL